MSEKETGTEIATQPKREVKARLEADGAGVMAIIPRDLPEAVRYANGLAASGIIPDSFRFDGKKDNEVNVNLVTMGVLKSLEIGLPPQTGLAFLLPINGRFSVWGQGMWALVQKHGQIVNHTVEWLIPDGFEKEKHKTPLDKWPNEYGVIVRIWRRGQDEPYTGKFTVGDARRAGLWNSAYRKPWINYPDRMLFNRARGIPLNEGFADALFGLTMAEEEMDRQEPEKKKAVDNSALDDDLPTAPKPGIPMLENASSKAATYKSGLLMIPTLEALADYQQTPDSVALMAALQRDDEDAYNDLIAANARRYMEIERADRDTERDAAETKIAAEAAGAEKSDDENGEDLFNG